MTANRPPSGGPTAALVLVLVLAAILLVGLGFAIADAIGQAW